MNGTLLRSLCGFFALGLVSVPALAQPSANQPAVNQPSADGAPAAGGAPNPHGGAANPHAGGGGGAAQQEGVTVKDVLDSLPKPTTSREAPDLAPGTLRVQVQNRSGEPVANQTVLLGVMRPGGERSKDAHITNEQGIVELNNLPTGEVQAYRVTVPFEGANYASTPFRLPEDKGYAVDTTLLPITRDKRFIILLYGETFVEFRDARLHIMQRAQLMNLGPSTFLFPGEGLKIALPEGAVAFGAQEVMTDQRVEEIEGDLTLFGSLPPGLSELAWQYDLPKDGTEMSFSQPIPFNTVNYRVIVGSAPGMELEVDGFPAAESKDNAGHAFLLATLERTPEAPPLDSLKITLKNMPGPGPGRLIAVGAAIVIALLGIYLATRRRDYGEMLSEARSERKATLLEEAKALEALKAQGEVGEGFYARQHQRIVSELASLLHQEKRA